MQARLARRAMAVQLFCGSVASRYGDSSYVYRKVSLQTDNKTAAEGLPDSGWE